MIIKNDKVFQETYSQIHMLVSIYMVNLNIKTLNQSQIKINYKRIREDLLNNLIYICICSINL